MHTAQVFTILCVFLFGVSEITSAGYHEDVGIPKAKWLMQRESIARIVGGSQAQPSAIPHQAGIVVTLTSGMKSICGGSLISNTRVVTAAHCWWDGSNRAKIFTIVLGSLTIFSGGTRIETTNVVTHPGWNTNTIVNDIAMVHISSVQYTNNIQAILLPTMAEVQNDFAGMSAVASGYGRTSDAQTGTPASTALYQIALNIITNQECQKNYDVTIHSSHLCTSGSKGVGTCDGDSGGPLTVVLNNKRTLVGIVSFGLGDGCELGFPSVFTRVTAHMDWINANM